MAFEVRFPNLFFIEARIGDFQVRVMKDFPQSELVLRRNFMFVTGNPGNLEDAIKQQQGENVDKAWQFKSTSGGKLEISIKNLVLTSEHHLSYHQGGEDSFRAIIDRVVRCFFEIVQIPVALRVGLRYINECPYLTGVLGDLMIATVAFCPWNDLDWNALPPPTARWSRIWTDTTFVIWNLCGSYQMQINSLST